MIDERTGKFNASSPDELALVNAAKFFGASFIKRDEENNMIVYIEVLFEFGVLHKKSIDFHLGKKEFCVPIKDLFLQQTQTFVFKNQGISKIKDEIDNVEEKSDIVAVIRFV